MRTLQSELRDKGLCKERKKGATKRRQPTKKQFSRSEIEELMGVRKPKYKKNKGAFRQY